MMKRTNPIVSNETAQAAMIDIVDGKTVRECLSMTTCIQQMKEIMVSLYKQEVLLPERIASSLFNSGEQIMVMPGALLNPSIVGVKTLTLYPSNPSLFRPAIQGLITLFDSETGSPVALIDAASITGIRTAAASAAATDVLAREDACSLALIGTGLQAETHLQAMLEVRPINKVTVWGRTLGKAEAFADRIRQTLDITIDVEQDVAAAVKNADIICTLTGSEQPILKGQWLKSGAHINMVGGHSSNAREVDTNTIKCARLFVEHKAAALKEAGDILIPLRANEVDESHIVGEIAQVFLGEIKGRQSDEEVTAYKSLGNAAQDLVAATVTLTQARQLGVAHVVQFFP